MKFGRKLEQVESSFPLCWQGHLLQYKRLKAIIKECGQTCAENNRSGEFFSELSSEVARINEVFVSSALSILRAHDSPRIDTLLGCFCLGLPAKRIRLPNGACAPASQDNILLYSRTCIEYAKVNALGLRKIIKKYDKHNKDGKGYEAFSQFWCDQSGQSFLHSPMLVELIAVQMEAHERIEGALASGKEPSTKAVAENTCSIIPQLFLDTHNNSWFEGLQCPICLDVPYKPISLGCSHIFCKSCLFEAAGHGRTLGQTSDILRRIGKDVKCPQCRQSNVFASAVILKETSNLLQKRYPGHWAERSGEEQEHIRQLRKEYIKARDAHTQKLRGFHPSYLLH